MYRNIKSLNIWKRKGKLPTMSVSQNLNTTEKNFLKRSEMVKSQKVNLTEEKKTQLNSNENKQLENWE